MRTSVFLNFLFLLIMRHRGKHWSVFLISTLLVMLVGVFVMSAQSLKQEMTEAWQSQPDFIVQKLHGSKRVDIPVEWRYRYEAINGIAQAVPRVYGRYLLDRNNRYCMLTGVDPFDDAISGQLAKLVASGDARSFMGEQMVVGAGFESWLQSRHYDNQFTFRTPDYQKVTLEIVGFFSPQSQLFSSDLALMPMDQARLILGMDADMATDMAIFVPNPLERENVREKLIMAYPHTKVVEKEVMMQWQEKSFSFKSALFQLLFVVAILTYAMTLYQRYSMISRTDRKEIGILRALGWNIRSVIMLKVVESVVVALAAFLSGFVLAFLYVDGLNAPGVTTLFLGNENLPVHVDMSVSIDVGTFLMTLLYFLIPFIAAVAAPVWRLAVTEPLEAMR